MSRAFSVILPAYNEEQTIARAILETDRVFRELTPFFEILVVDDGSTDRTTEAVEQLQPIIPELRLLRHTRNAGKGAAVKTGASAATGEVIVFLDCDLATHPSAIHDFLPALKQADIVIGSRRIPGAQITTPQPLHRSFFGRGFNVAVRTYLHLPFHDTQCGFKAFRADTRPLFAALTSSGWAFDVELLVNAQRRGFRIVEVPVTWNHGRDSRVRFRHLWQIIRELRRIKRG